MLEVTIEAINKGWDPRKEEFVTIPKTTFQIEHSLLSLKKWESKWHVPYFSTNDKTTEQVLDYVRCMTITKGIDPDVYPYMSRKTIQEIVDYINNPMTATWFTDVNQKKGTGKANQEVVTNEIIYYWMIEMGIPLECETWHLEQLLTLIKVINAKREPAKKMSQKEAMEQQRALNKARKARLHSKG